jgi:release factor glutamine methyltransferase
MSQSAAQSVTDAILVDQAILLLKAAGVEAPRTDAETLWHFAQVTYGTAKAAIFETCFRSLVQQRADRVPIGYLTGSATLLGLSFHVGPGVFVPRTESESFLEAALSAIADSIRPRVLDLFTGSAALGLSVAHRRKDAEVTAFELSDTALIYAESNLRARLAAGDPPITLIQTDICALEAFAEFRGNCDLVLANPPYVPNGLEIRPEFARHQPHQAIYSGDDGLCAARAAAAVSAWSLRPGGHYFTEHSDDQASVIATLLRRNGWFDAVSCAHDHRGLPRWSRAVRTSVPMPTLEAPK